MTCRALLLSALLLCLPALSGAQQSNATTYQDKLIDSNLLPDAQELTEQTYDREGLARGYTLETSLDRRGVSNTTQVLGLRATGYMDTLFWGSFSGQVGLQQGKSAQGSAASSRSQKTQWVLRQQGMPLDGGWQVDNALGQINLPVPELARNSLRLGLPTAGMLGVSSQWRQANGLQLNAALGQSGGFSGFPVASFSTTGGRYAYLSAQDRLSFGAGQDARRWVVGAALASAQDVPSSLTVSPSALGRVSAQSLYLAAQRQWLGSQGLGVPESTLQINALHSQKNGVSASGEPNATAQGLWLDGSFNLRGHGNQWGLFYLEPNLSWMDASVAANLQGGYWRHSWRTRQWSSESNIELLSPVQGSTPAGVFASQALRYQYSTVLSFGGSMNLRRYNTDGQSALIYAQLAHSLGNTRAQIEVAQSMPTDKLARVQIDHDVNATADIRFATSLSIDQEKRSGSAMRGWGLAILADWQLTPHLNFTNNMQSRSSGGLMQYTLNTALNWRIAPQWSLNATVFAVQGNPQSGSLVQSPLNAPSSLGSPSGSLQDKGVFISLRYTQAAGSTKAPIGGSSGSAAGSVQGVIFLDENGNGKQEASERGAAQVTVLLNGRFSAETDSQGRFEFPYVAAGSHTITVVSDNLPLPWTMPGDGKQTIRISTRDQARLVFGAIKN
jgi:hypothetical protein